MNVPLDPFWPVVVTRHADNRICQRADGNLDRARNEIRHGIVRGWVEWRARNIYYVHADGTTYVVVRQPRPRPVLVVLTVLTPPLTVAA